MRYVQAVQLKMADFNITVTGLTEPKRISEFLVKNLGFSRTLVTKVKYDNVFLNGTIVHMRAVVKNGDVIEINFPDEISSGIEPMDIPLEILFEDDHVLAVSKPPNMPTHPSRGNSLPRSRSLRRTFQRR